jgi:hypothetical protein
MDGRTILGRPCLTLLQYLVGNPEASAEAVEGT